MKYHKTLRISNSALKGGFCLWFFKTKEISCKTNSYLNIRDLFRVRLFFILCFFLIYLQFISAQAANPITGEVITAKAIEQSLNMELTVINAPPALTINQPKEETYISTSIILNITSNGATNIWWNIDGQSNATLETNPTTFTANQGEHILTVFANNSAGLLSVKSVIFTVNISRFTVIYTEYQGAARGSSTDFILYSYEELKSLPQIVLENTNYGKITFFTTTDLTSNGGFVLDLDNTTNISHNRIELNGTALPMFNKPAKLYMYNLGFSNPFLLKDGERCNSCVDINYSNGILTFTVANFSVYTAVETESPTPPINPPPGGGTKSGGSRAGNVNLIGTQTKKIEPYQQSGNIKDIVLLETLKIIKIRQGDTQIIDFNITNKGILKLILNLTAEDIESFFPWKTHTIILNPSESKNIEIPLMAPENTLIDSYIGKIVISDGIGRQELLVAIDVLPKEQRLAVDIQLPQAMPISIGQSLLANIQIHDLTDNNQTIVNITYEIFDSLGNVIFIASEEKMFETIIVLSKSFPLPDTLPDGTYRLKATVTDPRVKIPTTAFFEVITDSSTESPMTLFVKKWWILFIGILLLFLVVYAIIKTEPSIPKFEKFSEKPKDAETKNLDKPPVS